LRATIILKDTITNTDFSAQFTKRTFLLYTFLDLQIYWYYTAVLFYLSEEVTRLL